MRDNKNSYDHFLTPNERVSYARQSIDGTQKVIDECWKVIKNPKETEDRKRWLYNWHLKVLRAK